MNALLVMLGAARNAPAKAFIKEGLPTIYIGLRICPPDINYYLCGSTEMVLDARNLLIEKMPISVTLLLNRIFKQQ